MPELSAQRQIDTRAMEMAAAASKEVQLLRQTLDQHVISCTRLQWAVVSGVIMLLVGMIGVLINLYVLPHGVAH